MNTTIIDSRQDFYQQYRNNVIFSVGILCFSIIIIVCCAFGLAFTVNVANNNHIQVIDEENPNRYVPSASVASGCLVGVMLAAVFIFALSLASTIINGRSIRKLDRSLAKAVQAIINNRS